MLFLFFLLTLQVLLYFNGIIKIAIKCKNGAITKYLVIAPFLHLIAILIIPLKYNNTCKVSKKNKKSTLNVLRTF